MSEFVKICMERYLYLLEVNRKEDAERLVAQFKAAYPDRNVF